MTRIEVLRQCHRVTDAWMIFAHCADIGCVAQMLLSRPVWDTDKVADRKINFSKVEGVDDFVLTKVDNGQLSMRCILVQQLHDLRERQHHADVVHINLDLILRRLRLKWCGMHAVGGPYEERIVEMRPELVERRGDSGLRQIKLLRCGRDASMSVDSVEKSQQVEIEFTQVHDWSPRNEVGMYKF